MVLIFFLIFLCTTGIRSGDNTGDDNDDNDNNKTNSTNDLKCLLIMFVFFKSCLKVIARFKCIQYFIMPHS